MAEMLLINPRKRRARKSGRTAAQRRATAKLVAMNRSRTRRRRRNPVATVAAAPMVRRRRMAARRANPAMRTYRRRRNPAMLGGRFGLGSIMRSVQDALVQGGGAVAMDLLYGQIAKFLPSTLQRTPGSIGLGDATKAVITVFLGHMLKGPTRGLSARAATGALTVQAHGIIAGLLPSTMTLGYYTPGMVTQGASRIGPNRAIVGNVGRYTAPGATALLNRYTAPGMSPMLNGRSARMREGVAIR
jgi:hypothetical protein